MSAAVLFQNMPPLSPEEYQALENSIREHGIQVPIVVDENRTVIDGHHRQKIAQELGIECPKRVVFDKTEAEKRTLALSLNLDRRHLNREQRRALIAESIKADPQLPDLQHAKRTGASPTTVGSVRRDLEATGDVSNLETRTDSLGRQQPASKPREALPPFDPTGPWDGEQVTARAIRAATSLPPFDLKTGEVLDSEPNGKTHTRPEPTKPRRRPLTDQASDAGYELRKAIERLQRITEDDRFSRNKEEVTAHLRGHLLYAVEVCQDLLDHHLHEGA